MKDNSSVPGAQLQKFLLLSMFFLILGATPARGQTVNLAWVASPAANPTYNVYRSERNSGVADSFVQVSSGQSGLSFADSTVSYGHAYAYYVTSVSGGAESALTTNVILVYVTKSAARPVAISAGQVTGPGRTSAKR